jgi:two-component system chemotaxis sensor kinase CheA
MAMDDIVKDFLIESRENLDRLDQELVRLESDPTSKELLASIFRTIHTIKGSCGFLRFARLEKVAHSGENLLSRLRDGDLALTKDRTSGLLEMVDAVRHMLADIQATEQDGINDYPKLVERLQELQVFEASSPQRVEIPTIAQLPALEPAHDSKHIPVPGKIGALLVASGVKPEELADALRAQEDGDTRRVGEILIERKQQDVLAIQRALDPRGREPATETVRIGVTLLDQLMNLVGELVLARNQLLQFSARTSDAGLQTVSQRVNLIATELQEQVMKTRMQPIGNLWSKFPRTVRDLGLSCGKQVRLEMEGQDTELDRTIIEGIKDPLTHLVRNSMDHGFETPEVRVAAGKEATGCLKLRAFHEGGQVNIEISDDGGGLNVERIRKKVIERGLIAADQVARMAEKEVFNLIFLPGFSTAEKITNVSGRGVGMDVVKTNIEKIGGTVDLQSVAGEGTSVRVRIPLTLAIIPALLIACRGERFAIPQVSLLELVRLEAGSRSKAIEMVRGSPVYRLRGNLLPLVYLSKELGLAAASDLGERGGDISIVVLQADDRQFGLVVDEIIDTEEIVVKPLGKQLKGLSTYCGATILGDGRVALILDILGLAQRARVIADTRKFTRAEREKASHKEDSPVDRQTLLLLQNGQQGRMAIPLSLVARLEEFPLTAIEYAGDREVIQYRGQIMPLIRLSRFVSGVGYDEAESIAEDGRMQVVVYAAEGRSVGLVADRILDIVDEKLVVQNPAQRPGILGSSVIQQRVTDLLDVPAVVREVIPNFAEAQKPVWKS